jgi:phage-related protein
MGFWSSLWEKTKSVVSKVGHAIKSGFNKAKEAVTHAAKKVVDTGKKVVDWGIKTGEKVIDKAEDAVKTIYNDAKGFADKGFNILGSPFTMIALAAGAVAVGIIATKV